jgi:outer membrane protein insertion porin family
MRPGDLADIRQFRSSERRLKASQLYNTDPSKGEVPKIVFSPPDSEDGTPSNNKRSTAKRTGDPNSFRGQSPDGSPAAKPTTPAGPTVRFQSPDGSSGGSYGGSPGGYGGGFGGRAVNPTAPSPQPYTVNQAAPPVGSQGPPVYPPAGGYSGQPAYPPAAGFAGPPTNPPAGGYAPQPGYPQPNTGPPLVQPLPGSMGAPQLNPPGDFLDPPPPVANTEPLGVVVTTSEGQTGKFMFGAGVNSNAGLIGSIILDEQNFDWQRVPTSWEDFRSGRAFRGAGQKFRIELAPGTQVSRYLINFSEPYLFDTSVGYGMSGYYFQRYYRDWTEQRAGGRTSLMYQFTPDLSGNVSLGGEDIRISAPRITGVPDLDSVLGHTQLYSVKGQLAHDTRDNTFLATQGHYLEADFQYSVGSFQFPRFTSNQRQHILLHERPDGSGRQTLSFYNQFGITGKDTPIYERFYAGGFGTLRGFQFRGASPQINTVEVGGILEELASVEYMFPITADDMLRGVTFVDFGTVEYTDSIHWSNFRVAPGIGFRITIPMISPAPIAFDFAVPVHYAPNDIRQVFSFFIGMGH